MKTLNRPLNFIIMICILCITAAVSTAIYQCVLNCKISMVVESKLSEYFTLFVIIPLVYIILIINNIKEMVNKSDKDPD